ncbi:MAG: GNAT family N-acetyltransferase [Steroidobacteraceae bacterium]
MLGAGDYRREQIEGALQGASGGDSHTERNARELAPLTDAAKIPAFFVDHGYARRGVGRALLERCEAEARARGCTRFEPMGTLPGVRLYQALGYRSGRANTLPSRCWRDD